MGKTKRILSVCLGIMLTIVSLFTWNAVNVKADSCSNMKITANYKNAGDAAKGNIEYNTTGGGGTWYKINCTNFSVTTDALTCMDDQLYVRISPNNDYAVDFTAITLNDVALTSEQQTAIASPGGLRLNAADNATFTLADVEFKSAPPSSPQAGGTTVKFDTDTFEGRTAKFIIGGTEVTATIPESKSFNSNHEVQLQDSDEIVIGQAFNAETMQVKIYSGDGFNTILTVTSGKTSLAKRNGGTPPTSCKLVIEAINQGGNQGAQGGQGGQNGNGGSQGGSTELTLDVENNEPVYLVWKDGSNVYKHKFEISTDPEASGKLIMAQKDGQNTTYVLNHVDAATITADGATDKKYSDVFGSKTYWVPQSKIADENLNNIFTDEDAMRALTLNPSFTQETSNSLMYTPGGAFKIAIITDLYQGIASQEGLDYPECSFNDSYANFPETDISVGTEENPVTYRVYLEESNIMIKAAAGSETVTAVTVLGSAVNGVDVTKVSNGQYKLTFKSNYYDKVPVKIVMGSKTYYVNVVRTALTAKDNFGPNETEPAIIMTYTYLTGKTHDDFVVMARVVYKDGTVELKKATAVKVTDDRGNERDFEFVEGALCSSSYMVPVTSKDDVVGVYFTVTSSETDITKASEKTFGGTQTGSGLGVYYNVEEREVEY